MSEKKRLIVKVGSAILTTASGALDTENLRELVRQILEIQLLGHEVILVSSGSITCGAEVLGIQPTCVPEDQAAAAVGQPLLMQTYSRLFGEKNVHVGQILLSGDGLIHQDRCANARNTIETLLAHHVVPIINENDSVAIDEICFGDNDTLTGLVAALLEVDLVVLLSDVDAVYDGNPKLDLAARKLSVIPEVDDGVLALVDDVENKRSRGGMRSKLMCAQSVNSVGIGVVIGHGHDGNILGKIIRGESVGTWIGGQNANN